MCLCRNPRGCSGRNITKPDYFFTRDCDEMRMPGDDLGRVIADGLTGGNRFDNREVLTLQKYCVQAIHQRWQVTQTRGTDFDV